MDTPGTTSTLGTNTISWRAEPAVRPPSRRGRPGQPGVESWDACFCTAPAARDRLLRGAAATAASSAGAPLLSGCRAATRPRDVPPHGGVGLSRLGLPGLPLCRTERPDARCARGAGDAGRVGPRRRCATRHHSGGAALIDALRRRAALRFGTHHPELRRTFPAGGERGGILPHRLPPLRDGQGQLRTRGLKLIVRPPDVLT